MRTHLLPLIALLALAAVARPAHALTQEQTNALVRQLDERRNNVGDQKSQVFIERKERNKNDTAFEATVYRRDESDKFVILFQKPKEEAGKGYLRIDKNLFMYDPTVGKWERRTERERIAGTDSRRNDFDESRFAEEFDAKFIGDEKIAKFDVHHIQLTARPGVDVAFPIVHLWLDKATGNLLKQQEMALSGKLMRTLLYPKWLKLYSESKKADVFYPAEIYVFDEVEKGNRTTIVFRSVELGAIEDQVFTKAWLEARSR